MKVAAIDIVLFFFLGIAVFKIGELSFWLMGQRSTIFNIAGLLILLIAALLTALIIINKINEK